MFDNAPSENFFRVFQEANKILFYILVILGDPSLCMGLYTSVYMNVKINLNTFVKINNFE